MKYINICKFCLVRGVVMTIPDCAGFQPSNNTEEECEVVESRSVLQKDWLRTEDGASQPELTIDKLSARPTGPVWRREEKTGRTGNLQRALSQHSIFLHLLVDPHLTYHSGLPRSVLW